MSERKKIIDKILFFIITVPPLIFWVILIKSFNNHLGPLVSNNIKAIELPLRLTITHLFGALLGFLLPTTFLKKYLLRVFSYFVSLIGLGLIAYFIFLYINSSQFYNIYEIFLNSLIETLFVYLTISSFFLTSYIKLTYIKK